MDLSLFRNVTPPASALPPGRQPLAGQDHNMERQVYRKRMNRSEVAQDNSKLMAAKCVFRRPA
ncbi:hypothetical protein L226DRAFT_537102 [Lentinus tigrinus ALCF2SS1-7]|uniref:uncharacterized protein n=1 Tax=Lentinus tigrinus ALCF2SS1-7 TaxID=1328758 RepID=UPI001166080B|nr:hypothetical protein L226DRAFT_537102 [Lentinus tigrinus ALCF2SS1-7]